MAKSGKKSPSDSRMDETQGENDYEITNEDGVTLFEASADSEAELLEKALFHGKKIIKAHFDDGDWSFAEAKLNGITLRECNFTAGQSFADAILDKADLRKSQFDGNDFEGTSFKNTQLQKAVFANIDFIRTDFSGADLSGVEFSECDFSEATGLDSAIIANTSFENCVFSESMLQKLDMTETAFHSEQSFDKMDLSGIDFTGSEFDSQDFSKTILKNAIFKGATLHNLDFDGVNLDGVDFTGATLENCNFDGVTGMKGTVFDKATLQDCHFNSPHIGSASFRDSNLRGMDFGNFHPLALQAAGWLEGLQKYSGWNFDHANGNHLDKDTFHDRDLTGLNLSGFKISNGVFKNTILTNTNLGQTAFSNMDFSKVASLENTDFTSASFTDCILTGAEITKADFTNVHLEGSKGRFDAHTLRAKGFTDSVRQQKSWAFNADELLIKNANLAGLSLAKFNFDGIDFSATQSLENTDFTGAKFENCNLTGSEVAKADFTNARFTGSKGRFDSHTLRAKGFLDAIRKHDSWYFDANEISLEKQSLAGLNLSGIRFKNGVSFVGADLTGLNGEKMLLDSVTLTGAILKNANFKSATLRNLDFAGVNLDGVDFTGATLENCDFSNVTGMKGTVFDKAQFKVNNLETPHVISASFQSCRFDGAHQIKDDFLRAPGALQSMIESDQRLSGGDAFCNSDFSGQNHDGLNARDLSLAGSTLVKTSWRQSVLKSIDWKDADLREMDLRESTLEGGNLHLAKSMQKAQCQNTRFTEIDFGSLDIRHANFSGAVFRNCNFSKLPASAIADFTGARFENCILPTAFIEQNQINRHQIHRELSEAEKKLKATVQQEREAATASLIKEFYIDPEQETVQPDAGRERIITLHAHASALDKFTARPGTKNGRVLYTARARSMAELVQELAKSNEGRRLLQQADLSGEYLAGLDLRGIDFGHADLRGANFNGCLLDFADFSKALLGPKPAEFFFAAFLSKGVTNSFRGASMTGTDFSHANLTLADFTASTGKQPIFAHAKCVAASFIEARLQQPDFTAATLEHLWLKDSTITDACLRGAHYGKLHPEKLNSDFTHSDEKPKPLSRPADLSFGDGIRTVKQNFAGLAAAGIAVAGMEGAFEGLPENTETWLVQTSAGVAIWCGAKMALFGKESYERELGLLLLPMGLASLAYERGWLLQKPSEMIQAQYQKLLPHLDAAAQIDADKIRDVLRQIGFKPKSQVVTGQQAIPVTHATP